MTDPVPALLRALRRSAAAVGCAATMSHEAQTPWATLTFTGARHTVRVVAEPASLARWLAMLPEAELPLAHCFVASCAATVSGGEATIELLVIEE